MIVLLKKLKIILQSKYLIITLIFFTALYVILIVNTNYYKTKYSSTTPTIYGVINKIKIDGNKVTIYLKAKEKIIVNYYANKEEEIKQLKKYQLGDKIKVVGNISLPNNNTNFNLFNYRKYLLSNKIYWTFKATDIKLIKHNKNFIYKVKNILYHRIDKINNNYLNTFILGDNSNIDSDVSNSYQINGISHLFALSGMHVSLITSFLITILNKIIKKKSINNIIVSLFLIFYMFLTNFSPSIVRCSLFMILLFINNKRIKTINLFILFSCIMLIYNPYSIYNVAFLFSYTITFYLILLSKLINRFNNYFIKVLIISLISFIVSLPIVINSYHQINILSCFLNTIYVPFVSFILLPLNITTLIIPFANPILLFLTKWLEISSTFLSKISFGKIILSHLSIHFIVLYYLIISILIYKINKRKYYYLFLIVIMIFIHALYPYYNNYSSVTMIDVGQGDSILVQLSHNKGNVLIDTGGHVQFNNKKWMKKRKVYSLAIDTIIPYIKSQGITKLDYLILSHGDFDHMGEAINLVNNFKVEKVIFNCGEYNNLEQELIKVLDKKHIKYYSCIKELNIDNNKLYFLQTNEYDNENDNSNVIYTELNGYKFMFMGDASTTTEKEIMSKYNLPDIDALKIGHHGSKTSSSKEFIDEINPKYSIISVGKNNRYGHPNKEVLYTLDNSKVYRTDQDGSIMFKIKNNKLKIETCSP